MQRTPTNEQEMIRTRQKKEFALHKQVINRQFREKRALSGIRIRCSEKFQSK